VFCCSCNFKVRATVYLGDDYVELFVAVNPGIERSEKGAQKLTVLMSICARFCRHIV
jgi:hypothetical protein